MLDIGWDYITDLYKAGGSPILSYELDIDDGSGFVEVVGYTSTYTLNSVQITSAVVSGLTYQVKYRAMNIYGWGDFSSIGFVTAASVPGVPGTPTTSLTAD